MKDVLSRIQDHSIQKLGELLPGIQESGGQYPPFLYKVN